MKISLNWVKQFTTVDISVDELVKKIGSQLGAVEEVENLGSRYYGVVIAKVVECVKHHDADKLHICKIDDGGVVDGVERDEKGLVQVVCGAPNVREGLLVAWIPPGVTVPSTIHKDPFVLERREIRGVLSNGMLASAHELGISDDHSGLAEIDIVAAPGTPLSSAYQLDDYIIDVENKMFTHRPDCFGILGVAREIAGIQNIQFKSPDWYVSATDVDANESGQLPFRIENELQELVPRFMMAGLSNITVGPSPLIIQSYLSRVGIKPINNVVDITNYIMYLTGQPLHAFDYDKIKSSHGNDDVVIMVRHPHEAEQISLLNGKTIKPKSDAIMIATPNALLAIGGIMGGSQAEVDESTTNILLECATFNMYSIRRTSMAHGLFTDAVTRFNKGQSPLQNNTVIAEAITMLESLCGGRVTGEMTDVYADLPSPVSLQINSTFINERLGMDLSADDIAQSLANVEFATTTFGDELTVTAPFWRTDIAQREDIVEEVGRLRGFDSLPQILPRRTISPATTEPMLRLKSELRNQLSSNGVNEVLTYSFVHGNLLERVGQNKELAYQLSNAISPDLQYYRLSLLPSLLDKVHQNIKQGFDAFGLFEIGKVHIRDWMDDEKLPKEEHRLAFVFAADAKAAQQYSGAAYYQAKRYVSSIMTGVQFEPVKGSPELAKDQQLLAPFELERSAIVRGSDGRFIGVVGEFRAGVRLALKLPDYVAGFEIDLSQVLDMDRQSHYAQLAKFPKVEQDMTLRVPNDVSYATLYDFVTQALDREKPAGAALTVTPLDIYQKDAAAEYRHITLRITINCFERTLTTTEVNSLLDAVAGMALEKLKANRI